jgi:hypothetical protein
MASYELSQLNCLLGQVSEFPGVRVEACLNIGGDHNSIAREAARNAVGDLKDFNLYIVISSNSNEAANELKEVISQNWLEGIRKKRESIYPTNFIENLVLKTVSDPNAHESIPEFYSHGNSTVIRVMPNQEKLEEINAGYDMIADSLVDLFETSQWIKLDASLSASLKDVYESSNPYLVLGQGAKIHAELNLSDNCAEKIIELADSFGAKRRELALLSSIILFRAVELNLKFHNLNKLPEFVKEMLQEAGSELKGSLITARSVLVPEDVELVNRLRTLTTGELNIYLSTPSTTLSISCTIKEALSFLDAN